MTIIKLFGSAVVIAIAAIIALAPLISKWHEVKQARRGAFLFSSESRKKNIEARLVRSTKSIDNPFTWIGGKPTMVAARKFIGNSFLVLYENFSDEGNTINKALVSANCANNTIKLITQHDYEAQLKESGYDLFGNKLPVWDLAEYDDMLAVLLSQKSIPGGSSVFFDIACHWDRYSPMPA